MQRLLSNISCLAFLLILCSSANASPDKKKKVNKEDAGTTITLVTSGTGNTKEEATKNALRSALEQTYGAFVSSNSQVVNDELVKDEIVSISTGNIVSYEELSFIDSNPKQVSVSAVVSISRLQSYAQNKGMSAELAGNTFAMNLKMEELNKKNQDVALKHLMEQTQMMSQNLFDYELIVRDPVNGDPNKPEKRIQVPVYIIIKANANTVSFYDYFHKTLTSLAVKKITGDGYLRGEQGVEIYGTNNNNGIAYVLRGEYDDKELHNTIYNIFSTIGEAVLNCELVDNLGNISGFTKKSNYDNVTRDYVTTNKLSYKCYSATGQSQPLYGYRDDYNHNKWGGKLIEHLSSVYGVYFWMNSIRPKVGEKLYDTKLYLMYSADEISKVSKIEIRPKVLKSSDSKPTLETLLNSIEDRDELLLVGNQFIDLANEYTGDKAKSALECAAAFYKKAEKKTTDSKMLNSIRHTLKQISDKLGK